MPAAGGGAPRIHATGALSKMTALIHSSSILRRAAVRRWWGVTLVELLMGLVILGILVGTATVGYSMVNDKRRIADAITDIRYIETLVTHFKVDQGRLPNSLNETQGGAMTDPWGQPYVYTNLADAPKNPQGKPKVKHRKDKWLNPLNSDYDLYSIGKDGKSTQPLTAKISHDDIVRAGNGLFVDLAVKY